VVRAVRKRTPHAKAIEPVQIDLVNRRCVRFVDGSGHRGYFHFRGPDFSYFDEPENSALAESVKIRPRAGGTDSDAFGQRR